MAPHKPIRAHRTPHRSASDLRHCEGRDAERADSLGPAVRDRSACVTGGVISSWYMLHLHPGAEALIAEVWTAAAAAGVCFDASHAVFKRTRPGIDLALYFTPSANQLARMFGAIRCRQPKPQRMELLLGHDSAWKIHYPDFQHPEIGSRQVTSASEPAECLAS